MKSSSRIVQDTERPARFVVGIDLGTTNCAMCYVALDELEAAPNAKRERVVRDFPIPQAIAPNVVEARATLPSFFARASGVPRLPWESENAPDFSVPRRGARAAREERGDELRGVVGTLARDYGTAFPESFVASAKSWLCNAHVDRCAKFLPLAASADADRREASPKWSPVEISAFYLAHLRDAWNDRFPDDPLENQDVVLTIPASFDETARELVLDAAKLAKLPRVALVEEPQAAFYAWLDRRADDWFRLVRPGDRALVCDVGGGTTDFALVYALRRDAHDPDARESVKFYRVAVGERLLLGGDNLDLALARLLEQKLAQKRPAPTTARERALLLRESRAIKEEFLSGRGDAATRRVLIPGASSKLVGGGTVVEIARDELETLLLDGFFPRVPLDAEPNRRRGGLREFALPYAFDPAITKHLARFLRKNADAGEALVRAGVVARDATRERDDVDPARPDAILFNGGAFESPILRERVVETIVDWFGGADRSWRPVVLENDRLDLAVARGAAYYGLVLRGYGERVGASLARSYYARVAVGDGGAKRTGVCILPAQAEPGDEITTPRVFELEVDKPAAFPIFVSSVRATDAPGDLIELNPEETRELPPIKTALKTRSRAKKEAGRVKARLAARPTEIGTIELFLQEVSEAEGDSRTRPSRWTLRFDARGAVESDWEPGDAEGEESGVVEETLVEGALAAVDRVFADDAALESSGATRLAPGDLFREAFGALGVSKNEAPISALRRLAERALDLADGRRRSARCEARWLNLLGFALRPGFGASTDDWRVERAWKTVGDRLVHNVPECRVQRWILWRRVASGLSPTRQRTLAEPAMTNVRNLRRQLVEGKGRGADLDLASQEGAEIWRTLGALESLPTDWREELGDAILDVGGKKKMRPARDALVWSLGRLGARRLFRAPLDRVVPPDVAKRWILRLLDELERRADAPTPTELFALAQMARPAEDPILDVDQSVREKVAAFLLKRGAEETTLAALERRGRLVDEATRRAFGETLPLGLRWN